jgi:hypothetical protein
MKGRFQPAETKTVWQRFPRIYMALSKRARVERSAAALDVPEAVLFSAGTMTVPTGERGRLLQHINIQLSKLNNNELSRAAKMLTVLTD